ncbi:MAG TPA: tetratricopeptide repeat protein [Bacteroidota bacterium]|nr:tetratricopeptide repeat protein [Bacteroidota bacterium]
MKLLYWGILGVTLAAILTTGFQCASSEMTSAKLYLQRKDYVNAEKQLEKEVEKNPKSEEGFFLLGEVREELKEYRGMKEAFDQTLALSQTHKKEISSITLSVWGRLFNQAVDAINKAVDSTTYLDTAIVKFSLAADVLPESLMTRRNLGLAYFRKGDMANAATQLTMAFEKGNDVGAANLLGRIYLDSANTLKDMFTNVNRNAFQEIQNLASIQEKMKADDVRLFLGDSLIAVTKGPKPKKGEAKETWRIQKYHLTLTVEKGEVTKVAYDNDKPYTPVIDSSLYFQAVNEFDKTIDAMKKAQKAFPEDPDISEKLMNAYIGADRNDEARALLNDRVKKYPDRKYDRYNLGVFLLKDSSYADAITEFKEALRLDSVGAAEASDSMGSVKIDPAFSSAVVYNIAACYVNWGVMDQTALRAAGKEDDLSYKEKFKMALPFLERVVSEKKDDIRMWELLGQVYANLGMKDKALEAYGKADAIRSGKN